MWRFLRFAAIRLIAFPLRVVAEIVVTLFDRVLSRYLVAGCTVAVFWIPGHYLFGAGLGFFFWPTLVLGMALCGLWDGCSIFTVREALAKFGIVSSRES